MKEDLQQIRIVLDVIVQAFPYRNGALNRLYNDACIALSEFGVQLSDGGYTINGKNYEITPFAEKIIKKTQNGESAEKSTQSPQKRESSKKPEKQNNTVSVEKMDSMWNSMNNAVSAPEESEKKLIPEKTVLKKQNPANQQAVISKHKCKVVGKKNPSDIREFNIIVLPLNVSDNTKTADIAVEVERNGQYYRYVSGTGGQKSIKIEVDHVNLTVRGQWKDRKFQAFLYLGEERTDYELYDNATDICPEELSAENFEKTFCHSAGNSKIWILPHSKMNEPAGLCRCSIIQETDGNRQIHSEHDDNVLLIYLDGLEYRIYCKWDENKNFCSTIEQTE